ncbi:Serine/threonine-protein kinase PLK4 [Frankliniella fusca]|uniref:Serine/threonine-protein kinase PLK4 n=1 Tax=Frankliniella fusca TaxID=407009 RepID=A0AAE1I1G2_9NEOP|nr:Serine/threonine-protein kinase PLK4 [Frankliniella fusca]
MRNESSSFGERIEDYEVGHFLGKGGFATVHKARCKKTGLEVAIKMIDKTLMRAAGMVNRVKQEVSIHSRLKHPAVLELYTFFEDSNYVYLVLELCHNGELQRYLKKHDRILSEDEASHILSQIVQGLLYLHSHKILHRDMSLSNLLLTSKMQVKIADFGLATQLNRPDEKHLTMCGTPNYISPEVATRSSHGLEADVWGLGCMLYTLLVGHPPFDTDAVKSTLTRVVMADYKMPSHLSPEAQDLIDQLLKKNPGDRIKLHAILKHPFLSNSKHPLEKKKYPHRESEDSGMCTMTTEGTHSLQHSKDTISSKDGTKKSSAPLTVAAILKEQSSCNLSHNSYDLNQPSKKGYSNLSHPSYNHSSHQKSDKILDSESFKHDSGLNHVSKSYGCDSGDDSETERYDAGCQALLPQKRFRPTTSRSRSRSEDRYNGTRGLGSNYLKSKLSGCESGEFTSLPSKHSHNQMSLHHTPNLSHHAQIRHKACRHNCNNGVSTCSADCTSDINWKPSTLVRAQSFGHKSAVRSDALKDECQYSDDIRHGHKKCSSLTCKMGIVSLDEHRGHDACCEAEVESHCGSGSSRNGRFGSSHCSHHAGDDPLERHGKDSSSHSAHKFSERVSAPKIAPTCREDDISSPLLDRRRSLDTDVLGILKSSVSMEEFCYQLFTGLKSTKEKDFKTRGQAPPLNTLRLLPTRHRTKNAVLSILESGEVVIEFLKKKGSSREERVIDVCRISNDGLRIVLYQMNGGKGAIVRDKPPDLPEQGADAIFSYESLPEKHWKKYEYAVRFVNLVRAKTPKVTLYSDKAKSQLMENLPNPDFESCFYDGGKVSRTSEGICLIDQEGRNNVIVSSEHARSLAAAPKVLWEHFLQCYQHCIMLERCLSRLVGTNTQGSHGARCVFPVIVGRRPNASTTTLQGKENFSNVMSDNHLRGPLISPNTPTLKSFEVSSISTVPLHSIKSCGSRIPHLLDTPVSRPGSRHSSRTKRATSPTSISNRVRRVDVSGVGTATQLASGEVLIDYYDGSQLRVHASNNGISYHCADGSQVVRCGPEETVPEWLRDRLAQVPRIIQSLMERAPSCSDTVQRILSKPKVRSIR